MKKLIFTFILLVGLSLMLYAAEPTGLQALAGKTITAKVQNRTRTFVFSKDGQKVTLDSEYSHNFVKEINGVFIFEGKFKTSSHFDAFKVLDSKTVLVAAPSSLGSINDTIKDFTNADQVAANIEKLGVKYTIK